MKLLATLLPLLSLSLTACAVGTDSPASLGRAASDRAGMPANGIGLRMPNADALHAPGQIPAAMRVEGPIDGVPSYGKPYRLPGVRTWVSPFVHAREDSIFRDPDPFTDGGLGARGAKDTQVALPDQLASMAIRWHNVLFSDRDTGEDWRLLDQRGVLSRYWILLTADEDSPELFRTSRNIFSATLRDTSGDGELNDKDASVALLGGGDCREMRQVTPADHQLKNVFYVASDSLLVFELRKDHDRDGEFEAHEPIVYYQLNLDDESATVQPWHATSTTEELEQLYR